MDLEEIIHRAYARLRQAREGTGADVSRRTGAIRGPTGPNKLRSRSKPGTRSSTNICGRWKFSRRRPPQLMSLRQTAHECRREALAATYLAAQHRQRGHHGHGDACSHSNCGGTNRERPRPVGEWLDESGHRGGASSRKTRTQQLAQVEEIIGRMQALERGMGLALSLRRRAPDFCHRISGGRTAARHLVLRSARERSAADESAGDRAGRGADGALVGAWAPVWLGLWAACRSSRGAARCSNTSCRCCSRARHENSLLDRACHDAVHCQIAYGEKLGVPWGISESAFSALDRNHVYQYRAFGVPALALKRGQERDLVVAPYASALALGVEPVAAARNLRRLGLAGGAAMLGDYGYYESIDFSRRSEPGGATGIVGALLHGPSPGHVAPRFR